MKTIKSLFAIVFTITIAITVNAQKNFNPKLDGPFAITKTFKVNGTCEMCKHRIEKAINNLPGVWSSYWDVNSKTLIVTYNRGKINPDRLQQQIALAGHDTEKFRASDGVYAELPDCCQYSRKS